LWRLILDNLWKTVKIIGMVTVLMILIEYLELKFKDRIRAVITGKNIH